MANGEVGIVTQTDEHLRRVRAYYDTARLDYHAIWTGRRDHALHVGYYGSGAKNHQESLIATNAVVADLAHIRREDRVLDAGCGWGGTTVWLAREIGCRVVGITIVPHQIELGRKFAERNGVRSDVDFLLDNYTHTSFPDASFDAIIGIESIVHAEDKPAFLREAFRLLKPGGRLAIAEYILRDHPPLSTNERTLISPWLDNWAMPNLLSPSEYHSHMAEVGFRTVAVHDLSDGVRESVERLSKLTAFTWPVAWLLKVLDVGRAHVQNRAAVVSMVEGFRHGLWRYAVVMGTK